MRFSNGVREVWLGLMVIQSVHAAERPDIICEAPGEPSTFRQVSFSPDSRMLLTVDNESRLWQIANTNLVRTFSIFSGRTSPAGATFSPDGTGVIATGENDLRGTLIQWRISDGSVVWQNSLRSGNALLALPNTNLFALASSGGIFLMPADGSSDGHRLAKMDRPADDARVSRKGSVLAARENSTSGNGVVRAWRMSDETLLRTWNQPTLVRALDVSPDGQLVAVGLFASDTRVYAMTNEKPVRILATRQSDCLRFSSDGQVLLTVSVGKLMFWRVSDGQLLRLYEDGLYEQGAQADFSPDGKLFAYDRNGTLVVARMAGLVTTASLRTNAVER